MSAAYENLPVYKSAKDLVVYLEIIVAGFSRYYKYTIGADLRKLSYAAFALIAKANVRDVRVSYLHDALDKLLEIKLRIEVCADIRAFNNKNSYPTAMRKVIEVSRQCEGWLRFSENPNRQTPVRENAKVKSLGAHATGTSGIRKQGVVPQGSAPDGHKRH